MRHVLLVSFFMLFILASGSCGFSQESGPCVIHSNCVEGLVCGLNGYCGVQCSNSHDCAATEYCYDLDVACECTGPLESDLCNMADGPPEWSPTCIECSDDCCPR